MRRYTFIYILSILFFSVLCGEEGKIKESPILQMQEEPVGETDKFFKEFVKMLTVLGAMVATLLFVAWLFKKVNSTRMDQMNVTSVIKILERRVLSPKAIIYLIEVHNHRVVIGESHTGLVLLADIPTPGAAAQQASFEEVMEKMKIKDQNPG